MNQETKYLNALQTAEHFEWKDPYLLIYCKGFRKAAALHAYDAIEACGGLK